MQMTQSVLRCCIKETAAVEEIFLAVSPKHFPLTLSGGVVCNNSFWFCFVLCFLAVLDAAIQGNLCMLCCLTLPFGTCFPPCLLSSVVKYSKNIFFCLFQDAKYKTQLGRIKYFFPLRASLALSMECRGRNAPLQVGKL